MRNIRMALKLFPILADPNAPSSFDGINLSLAKGEINARNGDDEFTMTASTLMANNQSAAWVDIINVVNNPSSGNLDMESKEALANKSTSVTTDGLSDIKYPSVKAVKSYVDANVSGYATTTSLTTEITRASAAETTLTSNLASEITRATWGESLKEALANKSTSVTTDGLSDIKYPSVKAIKSYVDANIPSFGAVQSVGGNLTTQNFNLCSNQTTGTLNIGTLAGRTGTIQIGNASSMTISNGYVGIGTATPSSPLHVVSKVGFSAGSNSYVYFNSSTTTTFGPTTTISMSIFSVGSIITTESFVAFSDRRIKQNIQDIQDDSALVLFRRLQPKTYQYKDVVRRGTETVYGFIAQEVHDLLPFAAKTITDAVPNLYTLSQVTGDTLTVDTSKLEYDASGQLFRKLKLFKEDNTEVFVQILSVGSTTIQIDQFLTEERVFVYGQEVNNFHTLNKDAIWTVASAALQEVDRQLQAEKEKTTTLQAQCTTIETGYHELKTDYNDLKTKYDSLLDRIVALEN